MPYVNNNPASSVVWCYINYFSTEAVVTRKYNNCCYDVVRFVTFIKGQDSNKEIVWIFIRKILDWMRGYNIREKNKWQRIIDALSGDRMYTIGFEYLHSSFIVFFSGNTEASEVWRK